MFGVDEKEEYPFLTCYYTYDNPLSAEWVTYDVGSKDYLEAIQIFMERVQEQIGLMRDEQEQFKCDMNPFTMGDCIPYDRNSSIVGKVVVINAEVNRHEYRHFAYQLVLSDGRAADDRQCSAPSLPRVSIADGKGTIFWEKSNPNVHSNG